MHLQINQLRLEEADMDEDREWATMSKKIFGAIMDIGSPKKRKFDSKRVDDESRNVNSDSCKKCGGRCCKKCGCHFAPDDFENLTYEGLKREIEKGYISIDLVDGEMFDRSGFFYMLRVRNVGAPIVDYGYARSSCCLLTKRGCKLNYSKRPMGGKMLIPRYAIIEGSELLMCTNLYDIEECCMDWKEHTQVISKLAEYFKDKDFTCNL